MQKIIDSVSSAVADRLNNPFTNTFIISWAVFNWKPILYFILSASNVETKICTIFNLYSDICHVLIYPLFSTLVIIVGIPRLLVVVESINKKPNHTRKENVNKEDIEDIKRKTKTAEATIEMEDKIKIAQNMGEDNKRFAELEETIRKRDEELSLERTKNFELDAKITEIQQDNSLKINELSYDRINLRSEFEKKARELTKVENENTDLLEEIKRIKEELKFRDFIINKLRLKNHKLLRFGDTKILEIRNSDMDVVFFDVQSKTTYLERPYYTLFYQQGNITPVEISDQNQIDEAINEFKKISSI